MQDLRAPLSDDEEAFLNDFLLKRIPDDAEPEMDVGIFELSGLDGFFTAIVSGPNMIPPSQWLPVLWGEAEPDFAGEKDFEKIYTLLIRYMNSISAELMNYPDEFIPVFNEWEIEGESVTNVDEWCIGYIRGVSIDKASWAVKDEAYAAMILPMMIHGTADGQQTLLTMEEPDRRALREAIGPAAGMLHAYWLERRSELAGGQSPIHHEAPKVGRNDPCPCGSGKKYKKCCLH